MNKRFVTHVAASITAIFTLSSFGATYKSVGTMFGAKLGRKIDNSFAKSSSEYENEYKFSPPNPLEGFDYYLVQITPITKRIYSITARAAYGSDCKSRIELSDLLTQEFGKDFKRESGRGAYSDHVWTFADATGRNHRQVRFGTGDGCLYEITVMDEAGATLADEEARSSGVHIATVNTKAVIKRRESEAKEKRDAQLAREKKEFEAQQLKDAKTKQEYLESYNAMESLCGIKLSACAKDYQLEKKLSGRHEIEYYKHLDKDFLGFEHCHVYATPKSHTIFRIELRPNEGNLGGDAETVVGILCKRYKGSSSELIFSKRKQISARQWIQTRGHDDDTRQLSYGLYLDDKLGNYAHIDLKSSSAEAMRKKEEDELVKDNIKANADAANIL